MGDSSWNTEEGRIEQEKWLIILKSFLTTYRVNHSRDTRPDMDIIDHVIMPFLAEQGYISMGEDGKWDLPTIDGDVEQIRAAYKQATSEIVLAVAAKQLINLLGLTEQPFGQN